MQRVEIGKPHGWNYLTQRDFITLLNVFLYVCLYCCSINTLLQHSFIISIWIFQGGNTHTIHNYLEMNIGKILKRHTFPLLLRGVSFSTFLLYRNRIWNSKLLHKEMSLISQKYDSCLNSFNVFELLIDISPASFLSYEIVNIVNIWPVMTVE